MSCEQIQLKLLDFSRNQLSALDAKEIKGHLAECGACRELLAEEQSLGRRLRDLPMAVPRTDLWPLVRSGIRGRQPVLIRLSALFGTPRRVVAAGLAAVAVAAIIIISPTYNPRPKETGTHIAAVYASAQPTAAYDDPMGENTERILAAIEEGT